MPGATSRTRWPAGWRTGCDVMTMGVIIRLHGDDHREIKSLLPWYVTGQLDAPDHARVETHLITCPECQAEVRFERRLKAEFAQLPIDVGQSWSRARRRTELEPPSRGRDAIGARFKAARAAWRAGAPWLGWGVAAGLLLVVGAPHPPSPQPAPYHALGAGREAASGNVVVIFRPDTSERTLRETINASGARLVDGPTVAGGYVLHVAPARRAATLAKWRGRADIVLAEPIDSGAAP
jgi:anti-sigma factor RsiW